MPSLANLMEDYRNWRGRQDWEQGKGWQDFFGGDSEMQERAERFFGFGTGSHGVGGLAGMIKASHGSPHMFDKFDFSRIGTGEGAQAYGHGGYFAQGFDSPVAKQYQENVKDMDSIRAINDRMKELSRIMESDSAGQYRKFKSDVGRNAASEYDTLMEQRSSIRQDPGHLYNVELKWPDAAREAADPLGEHHLLDWDAPLSEQPEGVRNALAGLNDSYIAEALNTKPISMDDGDYWKYLGETYDSMREALHDATPEQLISGSRGSFKSPKDASERLRQAGIPGIRYLDQGSRSAGKGSRNYVMFDDQFPEIVSRNGVSLSDLLRR
jgi:hypothetical protein